MESSLSFLLEEEKALIGGSLFSLLKHFLSRFLGCTILESALQ